MPPKKWIDKKNAATFQVRYRSQADPLIHSEDASEYVLAPVVAPNSKPSDKIKTISTLDAELGDTSKIRKNEGEAAMYGIYYDDTEYDYMQHLRDMGTTTEAVFIEAPAVEKQRKDRHKKKQTLDQALLEADEPKSTVITLPKEVFQSEGLAKKSYQDQQDVPDALRGFQPDMDPRLREVLEALEDEAYVDDDEDLFGELAKGGEADPEEFEETWFDDEEDDGWQSDATEKAAPQLVDTAKKQEEQQQPKTEQPEEGPDDAWMKEFKKFKKAEKKEKRGMDDASSMADTMSFGGQSSVMSFGGTMSVSGRRRRREKKAGKALTEISGYSMSSSALFRTEGQTLLDDRFDKIEELYNEDDDDEEELSGPVPETRKDFDSIMDEFLGTYSTTGSTPARVRVKRGAQLTPMQQLDEIRRELGKARIR